MPKSRTDARPLIEAIGKGKLPPVKQLIADGLDPMQIVTGEFGPDHDEDLAAIHFAFTRQVPSSIGAYLLTLPNIDPNLAGKFGWRPLHYLAYRCGGKDIAARVEALAAAGADANATDEDGNTPLQLFDFYYASGNGTDLLDALVAARLDLNHKNNDGQTVVDVQLDKAWSADEKRPRRLALVRCALKKGATSRFAAKDLDVFEDPNLAIPTRRLKRAHAVAVRRSYLALAEVYQRAGSDRERKARWQAGQIRNEFDLEE